MVQKSFIFTLETFFLFQCIKVFDSYLKKKIYSPLYERIKNLATKFEYLCMIKVSPLINGIYPKFTESSWWLPLQWLNPSLKKKMLTLYCRFHSTLVNNPDIYKLYLHRVCRMRLKFYIFEKDVNLFLIKLAV